MARLIGELLTVSGSMLIAVGWLFGIVLVFWLPYMAWSATRNIRGIRIQLERLNDTLSSGAAPPAVQSARETFRPNTVERMGAAPARPGALGI
jgi:hypothetical protein